MVAVEAGWRGGGGPRAWGGTGGKAAKRLTSEHGRFHAAAARARGGCGCFSQRAPPGREAAAGDVRLPAGRESGSPSARPPLLFARVSEAPAKLQRRGLGGAILLRGPTAPATASTGPPCRRRPAGHRAPATLIWPLRPPPRRLRRSRGRGPARAGCWPGSTFRGCTHSSAWRKREIASFSSAASCLLVSLHPPPSCPPCLQLIELHRPSQSGRRVS